MLRAVGHKSSINTENRTADFVISDESIDRHGTIIKMDGWRLENYKRNPVVLYVHNSYKPDPDLVIGNGEVWKEGSQLMGRIHFEDGEDNPIAEKVFKKLQKGILRAVSVGFDPLKWSKGIEENGERSDTLYFREQDLMEFSVVPIPSNTNALKKSYDDFIEKAEVEEKTFKLDNDKMDKEKENGPSNSDLSRLIDELKLKK